MRTALQLQRERLATMSRRDQFRHAVRSWEKMKRVVYAGATQKIVRHPDGRVESMPEFTPAQQEILNRCDEMILWLANRYGQLPDSTPQEPV